MKLAFSAFEIVHPVTYINKVLAYNSQQIALLNPISQKLLFEYSLFTENVLEGNKEIVIVATTPIVDIVAVCLNTGEIVILNIRTSKVVFTIKQKRTPTAIAFSSDEGYMATADEIGNIILWDLEKKSIKYRLEGSFNQPIDHLFFVPGLPLLTAASSKSNSIRQFRINPDDSVTLCLFRERTGCAPENPIMSIKCHNDKEVTFSTKSETVFSSLYSHTNMYSLKKVLDSHLPYHVLSVNFNLEVFRERTLLGKLNLHENVTLGAICTSNKFIIVGTKSRLVKVAIPSGSNPSTHLHKSCEWKVNNVSEIVLCHHKYIYAICDSAVYVFNFNFEQLVATLNEGEHCHKAIVNRGQTMMALENKTKGTLEIWDMDTITLTREFVRENPAHCCKLAFTPDNRYLLCAQEDKHLQMWSIVQGCLYKDIILEHKISDMCFTPDGGYFLSVFEGSREINIWHSYIGKIATTQSENQVYVFKTALNQLEPDYRATLNKAQDKHSEEMPLTEDEFDQLLDSVPDAPDSGVDSFSF